MNNTIKLILLTLANFILVSGVIYWLVNSGVDITGTTLADNAVNLSFTFDYVTFLILSFVVNFAIISYPSKKTSTLHDIANIIERNKPSKNNRKNNRQLA